LASDRQHFAATAKHLASHGFLAVTVEHPGSNLQKFKQLLGGSTKEMLEDTYRLYLQAGYALSISQSPNQVSILRSLTPEQFDNIFQQTAASNTLQVNYQK
jgi:predicted dienelactone hydrolase